MSPASSRHVVAPELLSAAAPARIIGVSFVSLNGRKG
jgi:hypothetical protein